MSLWKIISAIKVQKKHEIHQFKEVDVKNRTEIRNTVYQNVIVSLDCSVHVLLLTTFQIDTFPKQSFPIYLSRNDLNRITAVCALVCRELLIECVRFTIS